MTSEYRKKPVEIEAIQYTGDNKQEILEYCNTTTLSIFQDLKIYTLEGEEIVRPGDYIIKGVKGEFYPCHEGTFIRTYDPI